MSEEYRGTAAPEKPGGRASRESRLPSFFPSLEKLSIPPPVKKKRMKTN
jgi:hypothetical protein